MKIWDTLLSELSSLPKTMSSAQKVIEKHFANENFCEEYVNNQIVYTSYDELFKQCNNVASYIVKECGKPKKDEVIFLQSKNSKNWIICFWGILQAGYIPVLIDHEISLDYFKYINTRLKPKLIINGKNILSITTYISKNETESTFANSFILLTSGTTDVPKIVEFNGESVYAQLLLAKGIIKQSRLISQFNHIDKIKMLMFLPLHHVFGLMANYLWFTFFGVKFVFINSVNPDEIQFACRRHGVTHFLGVPLVWETVAKKIWLEAEKQNKRKSLKRVIRFTNWLQSIFPRFGLWLTRKMLRKVRQQALGNTLSFLITGGASIDQDTLKLMNGLGYALHQGYGMTETGIVSVELSNRANKRNLLSVGKPFKTTNWRINKNGILELNGAMLPKKIIEKNRTTILNQDTWFTTNDKFIDRHGRLTIIGRSDDVIISLDGTNINPEDIERQFKFNAIVRCAAIAIRLPSGYDKIILVIGLPSNTSQTSRNEINYKAFEIIKSLPINMKPREIYFTNELPLTNLGKVKRGNIKQSFINSPKLFVKIKNNIDKTKINTQHSAELIKMIDVVRKCYAEVLNLKLDQVSEATDFILDLGGTSLDYYSLISKISMTVGKEIKLVETKTLTTPLDFALLLMKR